MDDSQINQMVKSLEDELADREMWTHTTACEKPDRYILVTANRAGCLELAHIFLKAAIEPIKTNDSRSKAVVMSDPDMQLISNKSDHFIAGVQRMEQWPEPETAIRQNRSDAWKRDRITLLGCAVPGFFFMALLYGGIVFWWKLITGQMP